YAPYFFLSYCDAAHPYLHSFPTRRSSDLPSAQTVKRWHLCGYYPILTRNIAIVIIQHYLAAFLITFIAIFFINNITVYHPINMRSEEHTSELQSRFDLVCRLLLEKKKQSD